MTGITTSSMAVFTDLDGTLLDHHTYCFSAAIPMLQKLKSLNIPVIPNTSKTFDELIFIRQKLGLDSPFIAENGAAVYIPLSFLANPSFDQMRSVLDLHDDGDHYIKTFTEPRQYWLMLLETHASHFAHLYTGFSSMSIPEIQHETGLSLEQAEAASKRHFGEPLKWHGSDEELQEFTLIMQDAGVCVVKGGRFVHVSGVTDKGQAMTWLSSIMEVNTTVALGDGENDTSMLEKADVAVQIRSPVHAFPILTCRSRVIQTLGVGPIGWNEAVETILSDSNLGFV
ncbi:HAD-IIB family hydrolase [Marinomonas sp. 2405UD68-3]|uniref:HAD-IIB family hydrolase n=1 Tax=Marinomonas sp. 2405UD68-3 TaxID=3391835 RepID=UPI0039C9F4E0